LFVRFWGKNGERKYVKIWKIREYIENKEKEFYLKF